MGDTAEIGPVTWLEQNSFGEEIHILVSDCGRILATVRASGEIEGTYFVEMIGSAQDQRYIDLPAAKQYAQTAAFDMLRREINALDLERQEFATRNCPTKIRHHEPTS